MSKHDRSLQSRRGIYRFGISLVFTNGNKSEVIWSEPIIKNGHGLNENEGNQEESEQAIQKVLENGQIVIIKDGKRYNVSGQQLN